MLPPPSSPWGFIQLEFRTSPGLRFRPDTEPKCIWGDKRHFNSSLEHTRCFPRVNFLGGKEKKKKKDVSCWGCKLNSLPPNIFFESHWTPSEPTSKELPLIKNDTDIMFNCCFQARLPSSSYIWWLIKNQKSEKCTETAGYGRVGALEAQACLQPHRVSLDKFLTSLCLNFLLCKIRIILISTS